MTNYEVVAYARIALANLLENNKKINDDMLFYEMNALFDLYSEEAIKKKF